MKWDEQWRYPKTKTSFFSLTIWRFRVSRTFSIISPCIQDFESAKYMTSLSLSAALANRKHLGVLLRQIAIGLPTFSPSALTKNATVILCSDFFSPLLFFPFWDKPLVAKAFKKHPLSPIFKISLRSYPSHSSFIRSIQDSIVVLETSRDSPEICFSFIPWLNFHLSRSLPMP